MSSPSRYIIRLRGTARIGPGVLFCAICGQRLLIVLPILPILPIFFALASGPHRLHPNAAAALGAPPRRELTLMRRRRPCLAAAAAWPQAPLPDRPDPQAHLTL